MTPSQGPIRRPAEASEPPAIRATHRDAELAPVEQAPVPVPPGFIAWRIVGTTGVTMLPALVPRVPARVWRGYRARVITNLTGRCPLCEAVADVDVDPSHRVGWALLPVTVGVVHAPGCSAHFTDADRRWFDSRALREGNSQ